jgi:hypothetical protein
MPNDSGDITSGKIPYTPLDTSGEGILDPRLSLDQYNLAPRESAAHILSSRSAIEEKHMREVAIAVSEMDDGHNNVAVDSVAVASVPAAVQSARESEASGDDRSGESVTRVCAAGAHGEERKAAEFWTTLPSNAMLADMYTYGDSLKLRESGFEKLKPTDDRAARQPLTFNVPSHSYTVEHTERRIDVGGLLRESKIPNGRLSASVVRLMEGRCTSSGAGSG